MDRRELERRKLALIQKKERARQNEVAGERWGPIPGFSNYYVSDLGRVKNHRTEWLIKQHVDGRGYAKVGLTSDDGSHGTKTVHRLVAHAFLHHENEDELEVNHKDGNKLNNGYLNLEWMTRQENIQHALDTGLWDPTQPRKSARGIRIVETGEEFRTQKECGDYLDVPGSAVRYALRNGTRTAGVHVEYLH